MRWKMPAQGWNIMLQLSFRQKEKHNQQKNRAGMIVKEGDKESPRILTTATGVMSSEGVAKRLKAIKLPTTNWRRFAPVAAS